MPTTEKFPKKVRLTLTNRIDNLALDVVMVLTEAQYAKAPVSRIREANLLFPLVTKLDFVTHLLLKLHFVFPFPR